MKHPCSEEPRGSPTDDSNRFKHCISLPNYYFWVQPLAAKKYDLFFLKYHLPVATACLIKRDDTFPWLKPKQTFDSLLSAASTMLTFKGWSWQAVSSTRDVYFLTMMQEKRAGKAAFWQTRTSPSCQRKINPFLVFFFNLSPSPLSGANLFGGGMGFVLSHSRGNQDLQVSDLT